MTPRQRTAAPRTPERKREPERTELAATGSRVVDARERFAALVRPRPWRRHRRALALGVGGAVLLLLAAAAVLLFAPYFQVQGASVEGARYADRAAIEAAADPALGRSVLLAPTGDIEDAATAVPGVRTAEVTRSWPAGVTITVTERQPVAILVAADGSTAPVDQEAVALPAPAAEGAELPTLTVAPDSADPEGASRAMAAVLGSLPADLRARVSDVRASTDADVTFVLAPAEVTDGEADGEPKTIIWGDARDAALKAEVVPTLMQQPGTVIDVSSPVAPVTR